MIGYASEKNPSGSGTTTDKSGVAVSESTDLTLIGIEELRKKLKEHLERLEAMLKNKRG